MIYWHIYVSPGHNELNKLAWRHIFIYSFHRLLDQHQCTNEYQIQLLMIFYDDRCFQCHFLECAHLNIGVIIYIYQLLTLTHIFKVVCSWLFSCDQAALWMVQSVRPSVCPSVRLSVTPFWLCSHHRIIMKFSGVITSDKSDVHAKDQGQRSKVKVTEVTTKLNRFRTVTPVWIHMW